MWCSWIPYFFLTALFFLTLNFNYKSFYSPSPGRTTDDNMPIPNNVTTPAMTNGPHEATKGEPVTFMFSGPDANRMMEQQLLSALAHPPVPARTWRFCNLDRRQCAQLSISALEGNVVNDER